MNEINEALQPYVGKPVGIRHHYSGVWLGEIVGVGFLPHMLKIRGRRVWSWSGGRLEFVALCKEGVRSDDRLSHWTETQIAIGPGDGLVELTTDVTEDVIRTVKATGPK